MVCTNVCHHRLFKPWYPPNPTPLTHHLAPLTPHPSLLIPHSSPLTPHPSHLTPHSSPLILPLIAQTSMSVTLAMVVARTCALTQLAPTIVPVPMATGWRRTCTPVSVSAATEWPCRKGWPMEWSHHPPHGWNKRDCSLETDVE